MKIDIKNFKWIREPKEYKITENEIEIVTEPHTDLWQRTYIILGMIMRLFCRWKRMKNISVL